MKKNKRDLDDTKMFSDELIDTVEKKQEENNILDNLGRKGAERIINDPTPFPEGIYRPNYYAFTSEKEEKKVKSLSLVKRKKNK